MPALHRHLTIAFVASLVASAGAGSSRAQTSVDHRAWQTPIKNQGIRTTCIAFAAIAAMEARYTRLGYSGLDLSEEFANYLGKMFWLHPNWDRPTGPAPVLSAYGPDRTENQVGAFGGGNGMGHVQNFASGLSIPEENAMPYRRGTIALPLGYDMGAHPDWTDPHWLDQYNVNTWNLDPANLPRTALEAPRYFGVTSFARLVNPRSSAEIESVLRAGYEVVWDFDVAGNRSNMAMWRYQAGSTNLGGHSMLIIGYDRSSANPADWHFLCKNSWGPSSGHPQGYQRIAYDYLAYGYSGGYITGVRTPHAWPELASVGRYDFSIDGHRCTLDIYHLPGTMQLHLEENSYFITDRRVGLFKDVNGSYARVNGSFSGEWVDLWIKSGASANMRWDETREGGSSRGRLFHLKRMNTSPGELAGHFQDNPGIIPDPYIGTYARRRSTPSVSDGFLSSIPGGPQLTPESYLGAWRLRVASTDYDLVIYRRDDNRLSVADRANFFGLVCYMDVTPTNRQEFVAKVRRSDPRNLLLDFSHPAVGSFDLNAWQLFWEPGVFANWSLKDGVLQGYYGERLGDFVRGEFTPYGAGCTGSNGLVPLHGSSGIPEVARSFALNLSNARASTVASLMLGIADLPLPGLPIGGAPGCHLLVNPLFFFNFATDGAGAASLPIAVNDPLLVSQRFYTQWLVLDPGANAASLVLSRGMNTKIGGAR